MKDYKLLFLKTIAPVNQSLKEDVNFTVFDVALAVRGGNDQKQNILQGAPKVAAVELQVSTQLLETQSDVEQEKGMRPLLKTQNYPRIITSKYIKKTTKAHYAHQTNKRTKICNSAPFFCFFVVAMAFHTLFFSHSPKKHGKHTPFFSEAIRYPQPGLGVLPSLRYHHRTLPGPNPMGSTMFG